MVSKTALVITSISKPNPVLVSYAEGSINNNVDFIVIGDVKSPQEFVLPGCDFWNIDRQSSMEFNLARLLPESHYARKNLGYLIAIKRGAEVIIETDDDNFPNDDFWLGRVPYHQANLVENAGWINIYRYFTDAPVWPRGFPLEEIQQPVIAVDSFPIAEKYCPIQQGLADENPDVDAIYRLVNPLPICFSKHPRLTIGKSSWTPFNSQNTTWFREAFPLLYLPSYCNFRMCDIWRSFVALRICHANDWGVLFHGPTVRQERNEHDLIKDFADEVPGYLNNATICNALEQLDIKAGKSFIFENILKCYKSLVDINVIGKDEIPLLKTWIDELIAIS